MTEVRVKLRTIVDRAIDEGLRHGLRRAYKHLSDPNAHEDWSEDDIARIEDEIWLALDDVVDISDGDAAP